MFFTRMRDDRRAGGFASIVLPARGRSEAAGEFLEGIGRAYGETRLIPIIFPAVDFL